MSGEGRFFDAIRKEGQRMVCEHKRLMSVNCVLKCLDCGEILPEGFQTARKQGKNDPEGEKPVKSQAKKKVAKTAGKGA